jgi:antitoxin component YwqK of YwqJK toxin-antitoxin module
MKFIDHNSSEKSLLKDSFKSLPYMDMWISSIVEGYIYEKIIKIDKEGKREEYIERYGKKEGEYKEWWRNGQLDIQCYYKEGKEEGEYKEWWRNGQLYSQYYFKEGKREGEQKIWYKGVDEQSKNKQLWFQCYYK